MQRFALAVLSLCLAVAPSARADEWSKTYTLTGKPDLHVETSDANIRVDTWDQSTIEARVTTSRYKIGPSGIQIYEHQTGNSVDLEVRSRTSSSSLARIGWTSKSTCRVKGR